VQLPQSAEVVVVGAGFAGAATAYHLAQSGIRDILVLEREATHGYHASGRNAAICTQVDDDEIVMGLSIRGAAFLRHPPAGFGAEPLLRANGSVTLCPDEAGVLALAGRASAHGVPHERVDMAWMLRRESRLAGVPAAGGVFFPTDGVIDIHALLRGFLGGARAGGARVELNVEVVRFVRTRTRSRIVVETSRGNVETSCVINAAGAWSREIGKKAGSDDVLFTPYLRHLFLTQRVPNLVSSLPVVWFLGGADEFYLRPEGAGYLVCGCDETAEPAPRDARVSPGAQKAMEDKMKRLAPWIAELGIARSWACMRTFTPDRRPVIGWDRKVPWLFWVAGLGGHGATASPAIGQVAAADILGRLRPPSA
jgi:glycine/D-amino acid oxidase-like deaminating enzyme